MNIEWKTLTTLKMALMASSAVESIKITSKMHVLALKVRSLGHSPLSITQFPDYLN